MDTFSGIDYINVTFFLISSLQNTMEKTTKRSSLTKCLAETKLIKEIVWEI